MKEETMKIRYLIAAAAVGLAAPAMAQVNNNASILQWFGNNSYGSIEQVGSVHAVARINQHGFDNKAGNTLFQADCPCFPELIPGINQVGSTNVEASISMGGSANQANIRQGRATNSRASIVQTPEGQIVPHDNKAYIFQDGFNADAEILQHGEFNFAFMIQGEGRGAVNLGRITQSGANNRAYMEQFGSGHQGFITQR
ncbi:MAG TPA: hypothetical protein VIU02_01135 [Burkholderiales bacterium]